MFWVGVLGSKVPGRIAFSQLEEWTPFQGELFFSIWPKGFCVSAETPAGTFYPWRDTESHILLFPVLGLLSQQAALSLSEVWTPSQLMLSTPTWAPLSHQRKGPCCRVALSGSQAHRHEWKHFCCCHFYGPLKYRWLNIFKSKYFYYTREKKQF